MNVFRTFKLTKQCFGKCISRYTTFRFKSKQSHEVAANIINNFTVNSSPNWDSLRNEICNSSRNFNALNVHTVIIDNLVRIDKVKEALSYIDDVKKISSKLPLAVTNRLLKIYGILCDEESDKHDEDIMEMYNSLKTEYKVLDSYTNEELIVALCKTKYWEKSLVPFKEIKIVSIPTARTFSEIAAAAFKNKNYSLGWEFLNEMLDLEREPLDNCYLSYLESTTENGIIKDIQQLEKLFDFFEQNDVCSSKVFVDKLQKCALKTKIDHKINFINSKGDCPNCKQQIAKKNLTEDEFQLLKERFLNKVIIGKDVFNKSTPAELQEFQEFLKGNKKYDVIIDGLNVAYTAGSKSGHFAQAVATVLRHFVNKNKKVLIFGRKHMNGWSNKYISYIKANSDMFLTENISQDDPFLLYCALNSGKDTILVTRDLMRGHIFLLKENNLKRLFRRWISQCRYELVTIVKDKPIFKVPLPYLRTAQKVNNHWHIFIKDSEEQECLCFKMKI